MVSLRQDLKPRGPLHQIHANCILKQTKLPRKLTKIMKKIYFAAQKRPSTRLEVVQFMDVTLKEYFGYDTSYKIHELANHLKKIRRVLKRFRKLRREEEEEEECNVLIQNYFRDDLVTIEDNLVEKELEPAVEKEPSVEEQEEEQAMSTLEEISLEWIGNL